MRRNSWDLLIYTAPWKFRILECVICQKFPGFLFAEEFILTRTAAVLFAVVTTLLLATFPLSAQAPVKPLTVEAIYGHGPLIGTQPEGLAWSPDGKHLTFIVAGELSEMEPGSDNAHMIVNRATLASFNGAGASEQDRDHRERYKMASYLWAPDSAHLLFDMNGRLWLYDLHTRAGVEVGSTGAASGDDPKFSPDGNSVSFIRDHGLAVVRLKEQIGRAHV